MEKIGNLTHSALASLLAAHIKRERKRDPFIEREMDAMDDFRALFMPRQRQLPDVKREERVPWNGRGAKPRIILMYEDLKGGRHCTVLERKLLERFCKLSSDISTGHGAILGTAALLPKAKKRNLQKNRLQNLFLKSPPQTVQGVSSVITSRTWVGSTEFPRLVGSHCS